MTRDPATPDAVAREVNRWTPEQLQCRTLQHSWTPQHASYSKRYRYYATTHVCIRCGTLKHQELDSAGYITASWYTYPEGYLSALGRMDAAGKAVVRVASLTRTTLKQVPVGDKPKSRSLASVTQLRAAK